MEEAIILQKIEFLELELEEAKKREEQLKEANSSLMERVGLGSSGYLQVNARQDQTVEELQKTNEQFIKDIQSLQKRFEHSQSSLEMQNRELSMANKELVLDLKQSKAAHESEKQDFLSTIRKLKTKLHKKKTKDSSDKENELPGCYKCPHEAILKEKEIENSSLRNRLKELEFQLYNHRSYSHKQEELTREVESLRTSAKQHKLELDFANQKRRESEKVLKNEIKFLINKLQQARNTESFTKERMISTGRGRNMLRDTDLGLTNTSMTSTRSSRLSERYASALRADVLNNY